MLLLAVLVVPGVGQAADLKISDCELRGEADDSMIVGVSTKALPSSAIAMADTKFFFSVYLKTAKGDIVLGTDPVETKWLTPPVDWKEDAPERVEFHFSGPVESSGDIYYGYAVGVYYRGQLIDSRYSRSDLEKKFPLPAER